MHKGKIILLTYMLVLSSITAFGQRFQKEYHHVDALYPYVSSENTNGYTIKATGVASAFIDFNVDKNGKNASFTTYALDSVTFSGHWFVRRDDNSTLFFSRSQRDSVTLQFYGTNQALAWEHQIKLDGDINASAISGTMFQGLALPDGFILTGSLQEDFANGSSKKYLSSLRIDLSGNEVWQSRKEIFTEVSWIESMVPQGDTLYFNWQDTTQTLDRSKIAFLTKAGQWSNAVESLVGFKYAVGMATQENGAVLSLGYNTYVDAPLFVQHGTGAICYDSNGQILWQKTGWPEMDNLVDIQNGGLYAPSMAISDGSGWIIAGYAHLSDAPAWPYQRSMFIAKLDAAGNILNQNIFKSIQSVISTLAKTSDGGVLLGYYNLFGGPGGNIGIIKTDANLVAFSNLVMGESFQDQNVSCSKDLNEMPMPGILALSSTTDTLYTVTNTLGAYSFSADTGAYTVKFRADNPYWEPCANDIPISFPAENLVNTTDFPLQAAVECPHMQVDINMPVTRRCEENYLYVHYCNNGTVAAPTASVQVILDPSFSFVSAEIPLTSVSGDTLLFELGNVDVFECEEFWVNVLISCDSTQLGQTVCVSAHISPDTICIPPAAWSGAQVIVGGVCEQDSVTFWIKNIGTAPTQILDYIIIEDMVVWFQGSVNSLLPNQADTIRVASNGNTYGLISEQEPNYPFNSPWPFLNSPAAWVEACNWSGSGNYPGGFITQFPNEDGSPTIASDCHVLTGSYDPNDKQATPEGVGSQHFILPNTPLEYTIRFQNTGTDTAFQVIIRDDLSALLDPLTVRLQSSSHPCTIDFEGNDILKFNFVGIELPDSNTNLAASQGFVKFTVQPKSSTGVGQVIENTAAIYFDQNPAIYTNTYFHTVDTNFLPQHTTAVITPKDFSVAQIPVYPNPCHAGEAVWVPGNETMQEKISILNVSGLSIGTLETTNGKMILPKNMLPGVYFLKSSNGRIGRLTVL